jgi:hypothetical protein
LRSASTHPALGKIAFRSRNFLARWTSGGIWTLTFDGNPNDALVADLNADAKPDVAVSGTAGSNGGRTGLRIALNAGGNPRADRFSPVPAPTCFTREMKRAAGTLCVII